MSAAGEFRGLVGGLLIACGFVVALLCGTCSGTFGFLAVVSAVTGHGFAPFALTWPFLLAGLVAAAAGAGLIALGMPVSRGAAPSPPQDQRDGE